MPIKNFLLLLFILIIINKALDKFLSLSEKIKFKKLESLNLDINNEFDYLVERYIKSLGYTNIDIIDGGEMIAYNNESKSNTLIAYSKVKDINTYIDREEIMRFTANINLTSSDSGIFITNGIIENDLKNKNRDLIYYKSGIDLLIELKKIKLNETKTLIKKGCI